MPTKPKRPVIFVNFASLLDLACMQGLSAGDAALELGISNTTFKKMCRVFHVSKWHLLKKAATSEQATSHYLETNTFMCPKIRFYAEQHLKAFSFFNNNMTLTEWLFTIPSRRVCTRYKTNQKKNMAPDVYDSSDAFDVGDKEDVFVEDILSHKVQSDIISAVSLFLKV